MGRCLIKLRSRLTLINVPNNKSDSMMNRRNWNFQPGMHLYEMRAFQSSFADGVFEFNCTIVSLREG